MTPLVSVLFSEPKIPQSFERYEIKALNLGFSALQRAENSSISVAAATYASAECVSVLFSEPKIPQWFFNANITADTDSFSALQRAENSSISTTS